MTLPTQTWRISKKYNLTVAGSSVTLPEIYTGIKAMFDAEDVLGNNYWTYCQSTINGSDSTMMFKRKGSPTGTLGTFRAGLVSSSATPSATNMGFDVTAAADKIYGISSQDHNSDSFSAAFSAGLSLSGSYCKGVIVTPTSAGMTQLPSTSACKIFIVECDRVCSIWITTSASNNAALHFTFGEIVEGMSGVGLWGHFSSTGSGSLLSAEVYGNELINTVSYIQYINNTTMAVGGMIWDGVAKGLGRASSGTAEGAATPTTPDMFTDYDNERAVLFPILAAGKAGTGTAIVRCIGVFRQLRYSFRHASQIKIRDSLGNVSAISIAPGFSLVSKGLLYDQYR